MNDIIMTSYLHNNIIQNLTNTSQVSTLLNVINWRDSTIKDCQSHWRVVGFSLTDYKPNTYDVMIN